MLADQMSHHMRVECADRTVLCKLGCGRGLDVSEMETHHFHCSHRVSSQSAHSNMD